MGIFVEQLLAGRDYARDDLLAGRMANFVYVVGDSESRQCMVVDPAWDAEGILGWIDQRGLTLAGVLVTHYHPDHVGGDMFGHHISGIRDLLALRPVPVYANVHELEGVAQVAGISSRDLTAVQAGDDINIGSIKVKALHTPGHTPGSQCFLAGASVISGDTLFTNGCGRVDLPGGNPEDLYYSLTRTLAKLPDGTVLYPGHNYGSEPSSTIGEQKRTNYYLKVPSIEDWLALMDRG